VQKKQGKSGEKLKSEDKYKDYKENAFSISKKSGMPRKDRP